MNNIEDFLSHLGIEQNLTLDDIPNIDLYMDQVIQLFETTFGKTKRNEQDKILTKTMINNYAKGKLFFPIKNKRYSKEHLILISLIFQLKGTLSLADIKILLDDLNEKVVNDNYELDELYTCYLQLVDDNIDLFKEDIRKKHDKIKTIVENLTDEDHTYFEQLLLILALSNLSQFYRRAAEKLVDELYAEE